MATETVPGTASSDDPKELRSALRDADMLAQQAEERIEALTTAIRVLLLTPTRSNVAQARELASAISEAAFTAMECINGNAELLGCNYITAEEVAHV